MLGAAYWLAVIGAFAGGLFGNRTAWPLLASAAAGFLLDYYGASFSLALWLLIDFLAMCGIVMLADHGNEWPRLTGRDKAVLALFPLAWPFYFAPDPLRCDGSTVVVIVQLAICFPVRRAWRRTRAVNSRFDPWEHLNLRVQAA